MMKSSSVDCARFTSLQRGEVGLRLAMRSIVQCNPGEGPQRTVRLGPLTRIASFDATRPLPTGEVIRIPGLASIQPKLVPF